MIQRETTTDQLLKVIHVLQLGKKTGLLTVERGEGSTFEEGFLVFIEGHVTEARVDRRDGVPALNWLSTWGKCRFAFLPQRAQDLPHLLLSLRRQTDPALPLSKQLDPRATKPLPVPERPPQQEISSAGLASMGRIPRQVVGVSEGFHLLERAGLSRTHKHVFLLIDGHRTMTELARLTRQRPKELSHLVSDLERIGVVQS